MKKFSSKLVLLITAFMIFMTPALTKVAAEETQVEATTSDELVILHTNDMHGQITKKYELAYLKAYEESINAAGIFDAGDASQGLPENNVTKGRRMGELVSQIGFKAVTVGNHEFDFSLETAIGKEEGYVTNVSPVPVIATNVFYNGENPYGNENEPVYQTSTVLDLTTANGDIVKVSVFGLATPESAFKADPRHSYGIDFRDPISALKAEMEKPEHADTEYNIVLAHLGNELITHEPWRGTYVAEQLSTDPFFTDSDNKYIFIDGHAHIPFSEGAKYGNNVIYGQTGGSLSSIGEMHINLDDFSQSTAKLVPIADTSHLTPNQAIKEKIDTILVEYDQLTDKVLVENNPNYLEGKRSEVRTRETNLGNLIADSMYTYGLDLFGGSDFAVMNGGGIREPIEPGPLTLKEVLAVMPFANRVVQIDVTGSQVVAMYEHALAADAILNTEDPNALPTLDPNARFLHSSSSIEVRFDPRNPAQERVQSIKVLNKQTGEFEDLDLDKTYKVVTIEFLAVGGDDFTMLGGTRQEGGNDADAFAEFLEKTANKPEFDWTVYDDKLPATRVIPTKFINEDTDEVLLGKVGEANTILEKADDYTETSVTNLRTALDAAEDVLNRLAPTRAALNAVSEEEYNQVLANLTGAINNMEKKDVKPTEPEDPKPPVVEPEKPTDKTDPKTPGTGIETNLPLVSSVIALLAGGGYLALRKRKD